MEPTVELRVDIARFVELEVIAFAVIALVASYVPTRRATHVDPAIELRSE